MVKSLLKFFKGTSDTSTKDVNKLSLNGKIRFPLRLKFVFYTVLIAVLPLTIAGNNMILIMEDELKSAAQEMQTVSLQRISRKLSESFQNEWLTVIEDIRQTIDNKDMSIEEKITRLNETAKNQKNIVSFQIAVQGIEEPILVVKNSFAAKLEAAFLEPVTKLNENNQDLKPYFDRASGKVIFHNTSYIKELDTWLLTLAIPLSHNLSGRSALIVSKIDLSDFKSYIQRSTFRTVKMYVVERGGKLILNSEDSAMDVSNYELVQSSMRMLDQDTTNLDIIIGEYENQQGEETIGAYGFVDPFPWALIMEEKKDDAYISVLKMRNSLFLWFFVGVLISIVAAFIISNRITRPITKISEVASQVQEGNLSVRVQDIRTKDEIEQLAKNINSMITGLIQKFQFEKFVSKEAASAIHYSGDGELQLGGEKQDLTVLFSDIRGFTSFSETVAPEIVVEMLNLYLKEQAEIVKEFNGDIDKFVGDELMAVFRGPKMVDNAIRCAIKIQEKIRHINSVQSAYNLNVGIGINSGEVISGATGSQDRMDYTILGDVVNTCSRLCAVAEEKQILITEKTIQRSSLVIEYDKKTKITIKGKKEKVEIAEIVKIEP